MSKLPVITRGTFKSGKPGGVRMLPADDYDRWFPGQRFKRGPKKRGIPVPPGDVLKYQRPLILRLSRKPPTEGSREKPEWIQILEEHYGKKGKALVKAVRKDTRADAVVAVYRNQSVEAVFFKDLGGQDIEDLVPAKIVKDIGDDGYEKEYLEKLYKVNLSEIVVQTQNEEKRDDLEQKLFGKSLKDSDYLRLAGATGFKSFSKITINFGDEDTYIEGREDMITIEIHGDYIDEMHRMIYKERNGDLVLENDIFVLKNSAPDSEGQRVLYSQALAAREQGFARIKCSAARTTSPMPIPSSLSQQERLYDLQEMLRKMPDPNVVYEEISKAIDGVQKVEMAEREIRNAILELKSISLEAYRYLDNFRHVRSIGAERQLLKRGQSSPQSWKGIINQALVTPVPEEWVDADQPVTLVDFLAEEYEVLNLEVFEALMKLPSISSLLEMWLSVSDRGSKGIRERIDRMQATLDEKDQINLELQNVEAAITAAKQYEKENDIQHLVGYYVWARLGYNATLDQILDVLSSEQRERFLILEKRNAPLSALTMHDLMMTQEGRDWWRAKGFEWKATFDVRPKSKDMKVLETYMKAKAESKGKSFQEWAKRQAFSIDLFDEYLLDRVWDQIASEERVVMNVMRRAAL